MGSVIGLTIAESTVSRVARILAAPLAKAANGAPLSLSAAYDDVCHHSPLVVLYRYSSWQASRWA